MVKLYGEQEVNRDSGVTKLLKSIYFRSYSKKNEQ